jgi:hypothetical protein
MFNKELFRSHLDRVHSARTEYEAFDAAWKAFNVYYESLFKKGQKQELERVHLAVKALQ